MKPRELLKILHKDGWFEIKQKGSHLQLKHETKKGKITVSMHKEDIPVGTLNAILKHAGLKK